MDPSRENERIEAAEAVGRSSDDRRSTGLVGHVAADGERHARDIRCLQIGGRHVRPVGGQSFDGGTADAATRAGDENPQLCESANGKTSLIAATAASLSPSFGTTSNVSCRSYPERASRSRM